MSSVIANSYSTFTNFYEKAKARGIVFQGTERGSEYRLIGTPSNSTKSYNIANPGGTLNFQYENEFWNYNLTTIGSLLQYSNVSSFPATGSSTNTYVDLSDSTNGKYYLWKTNQYVQLIQLPDPNGNIIYSKWIQEQRNIYSYANSVGLSSDFYIGLIRDLVLNTPATQIALDMVQCTDRIYLSWYVTSAEFESDDAGLNYVRTRLNLLGEAAYSLGKRIQVIPIFAGTSAYMQSWFAIPGNTLSVAYKRALRAYNINAAGEITANAKLGLDLECGYQGYSIDR